MRQQENPWTWGSVVIGGETIVQGRAWDLHHQPYSGVLRDLDVSSWQLRDELLRRGLPALSQCRGHPIPVITGDCMLPLEGDSTPLCHLLSDRGRNPGPQQSMVSLQSPDYKWLVSRSQTALARV